MEQWDGIVRVLKFPLVALHLDHLSLEEWGGLIAILGFPIVALQLFIARRQQKDAIRLSKSQVLLAIDAVLANYWEMNVRLRPLGPWAGEKNSRTHPTEEELPLVEPYLGVFERIFVAYQIGQIDVETIDQLYGYRERNIWANQRIVERKLQNPMLREAWRRLIALTYVLEAHRGEVHPLHTDTYFPAQLFGRREARKIRRNRLRKSRARQALTSRTGTA